MSLIKIAFLGFHNRALDDNEKAFEINRNEKRLKFYNSNKGKTIHYGLGATLGGLIGNEVKGTKGAIIGALAGAGAGSGLMMGARHLDKNHFRKAITKANNPNSKYLRFGVD